MAKYKITSFHIVIFFLLAVLIFEVTSFYRGISYIVNKYKWQDTFAKLNSSYFKTSMEYGSLEPSLEKHMVFETLTKNLNVKKLCQNSVKDRCWAKKSFYINGSTTYSYDPYPGFILDNGVSVSGINDTTATCDSQKICNIISIDINGLERPNKFGADQFRIYYFKDKVVPYYHGDDNLVGTTVKHYLNFK
ncbi:MAG: hypothetical protein A2287_10890 [Candidatus Melainabacteria bacterium RIFOXYA12_FULL_32_12]|nr:MAG: hypothetical protein A2287_10890 [Candidatus Melainabacteria bacterium RIFOXYA12_FULL_32_12]